jgi:hypothetical protein
MRVFLLIFLLSAVLAASARAGDAMTPLPKTPLPGSGPCDADYAKQVGAYTPIVGDIMRFDAMFENYASLCSRESGAKKMKPFIDSMRARTDRDVNDSYHVMTRIIKGILPDHVAAACRNDHDAQERTVKNFHEMMNAQYDKAKHRLERSADGIGEKQRAQVCRGLADMKAEFEKHVSGKDFANPLFEIAFLRGLVLPSDPRERNAYDTYRTVLKGMQDERAQKTAPPKAAGKP